VQLNLKASQDTIDRFAAIAEAHGWSMAEAFEHALAALEQKLSG
jgi:hypothetical protein